MIKEKILNGERLTEIEVQQIAWEEIDENEGITVQTTIEGDDLRWSRIVGVVLKIEDRFFMVHWLRGLTEYQTNGYPDQIAQEVVPIEVTTIDWNVKEKQ